MPDRRMCKCEFCGEQSECTLSLWYHQGTATLYGRWTCDECYALLIKYDNIVHECLEHAYCDECPYYGECNEGEHNEITCYEIHKSLNGFCKYDEWKK